MFFFITWKAVIRRSAIFSHKFDTKNQFSARVFVLIVGALKNNHLLLYTLYLAATTKKIISITTSPGVLGRVLLQKYYCLVFYIKQKTRIILMIYFMHVNHIFLNVQRLEKP